MARVHIEQGDLTVCPADAIVNAANSDLILGGGLAGALRRRGGPRIQQECDAHGAVPVGAAALTTAGNLPAKFVIHQASMSLGEKTTAESLRQSTRAVLRIAEQTPGIHSLAFPAVGTGIAGFDLSDCAEIMLAEVSRHVAAGTKLRDITFVLFDTHARDVFRRKWKRFDAESR